jgi:hypothetical protein
MINIGDDTFAWAREQAKRTYAETDPHFWTKVTEIIDEAKALGETNENCNSIKLQ